MRDMKMMKNKTSELHEVLDNLREKKYHQIPKELVWKIVDLEEQYVTNRQFVSREIEKLIDDFIDG